MTFTKGIKEAKIILHDGMEVEVSDSATDRNATDALVMFETNQRVQVMGEDKVTLIPYHAIIEVEVTSSSVSVDRADPYGCEASSGNEGVIVDESKACEGELSE